ncbi:TetR/AcrR family transcriptional regulator [Phytomonospora endophytica]|uniref:AcrR family transcriptional regulator n=1 Tax=Phytomonospora endophytica TaxID=714109 RepID=A0A841FM39_9ACTN|nr:TetR/AcrR family transcriptional regulator [Phytomonospora endophytica]MBB6034602.1 AcrR family transcriptional regulator [Phytomonospora endophytica]GIG71338.1 TetR family transcriptional regulator [Phytomonospora endophytica]
MVANREQIARAAIRRLNADPVASMTQIAESAGVSRATLHRHFASREELMGELGRLSVASWRQVLDDAGVDEAVAEGSAAAITAALDALCHHWIRDVEEFGFALTETGAYGHDELLIAVEEQHAREHAFYAAAQHAGVVRGDMSAVWIAHAAFGLLVGLREALRRGDIAVRDGERLLRESFLRGCAA